jgi:3-hydroxyisobutyrate dehydrogenase/2-hydroxy-3-oxopropionate reductase
MASVAVIGLGGMGGRIARRLLAAGEHQIVVWNRTPEKTAELARLGAAAAESPAEAARRAEAVITMVADPEALQAVTEGPSGIAAGAGPGSTVLEMSTVGPSAISRLASVLPEEVGLLDAPVLGSLEAVESGTLEIFVGGPVERFARWSPLLAELGSPHHVGPVGAGAAAKLVANATLLGMLGLLGEALALAAGLGLAPETAFELLGATPLAAQAERRRRAVETSDYPARFSLALARKDADLIAAAAFERGLSLPLTAAARSWFVAAEEAGLGDRDYSAVLAHILER